MSTTVKKSWIETAAPKIEKVSQLIARIHIYSMKTQADVEQECEFLCDKFCVADLKKKAQKEIEEKIWELRNNLMSLQSYMKMQKSGIDVLILCISQRKRKKDRCLMDSFIASINVLETCQQSINHFADMKLPEEPFLTIKYDMVGANGTLGNIEIAECRQLNIDEKMLDITELKSVLQSFWNSSVPSLQEEIASLCQAISALSLGQVNGTVMNKKTLRPNI